MAAREIVRTLTIRNKTEGAQEVARDLNEVKRAADGVVQSSERTERQTLSNSRAFERLQRSLDPTYRKYRDLQSAVRTLSSAVEQGNTSLSEANSLAAMASQRFGLAADEVRDLASAQMLLDRGYLASNRSLSSANDNIRLTNQQMMGLGYQLNDVATMLMMGASPFQIMASQGGQVYQVLGDGPGGVSGSLRALGSQLGSLATRLAPIGISVAALGTGISALRSEINETSNANVSFGDVALGVWQMMADGFTSIFRGPIETVQGWWRTLWENVESFAVSEFNNIARNVAQLGAEIGFAVDVIEAHWEGSLTAIKAAWELLPGAIGDIVISTANRVVQGVEDMVNGTTGRINALGEMMPDWVPEWARPNMDEVKLDGIGNPWKGQADSFAEAIRRNASNTFDAQAEAFSRLQDRKDEIAGWNPFEGLKARATANALSDVETAAAGAGSALSAAANDNVDPWKGLRGAVDTVNEGLTFARNVTGGFVSDLRSGLEDGAGFWRSFADAASGAMDKIIDKLLNEVLDSIFQVNRAASGMGGGGGILSGIFGGLGSIFGGGTSPFSSSWMPNSTLSEVIGFNANGTENWRGGLTWVGERGPEIVDLPRGARVIPNHRIEAMTNNNQPMPANDRGGVSVVQLQLSPDLEARVLQEASNQSIRIADKKIDNFVEGRDFGALVQRSNRRRRGGGIG